MNIVLNIFGMLYKFNIVVFRVCFNDDNVVVCWFGLFDY